MNIHDACVTAGFMWAGVAEDDKLPEVWAQACLELCQEVTQYAELSELYLEAVFRVVQKDFPGVYDYEVSEPFGNWFRDGVLAGTTPTKETASANLAVLVWDFFTNHIERDDATLRSLRASLNLTRNKYLGTYHANF